MNDQFFHYLELWLDPTSTTVSLCTQCSHQAEGRGGPDDGEHRMNYLKFD